jgi:hypothetical protein
MVTVWEDVDDCPTRDANIYDTTNRDDRCLCTVGVACLELMNWVRVTGAGQVYWSHIGGCAPDRVI